MEINWHEFILEFENCHNIRLHYICFHSHYSSKLQKQLDSREKETTAKHKFITKHKNLYKE